MTTNSQLRRKVRRVIDRLEEAHGRQEWHCHGDALDVLIGTILSQNTSNRNSRRAFKKLKATFPAWDATADAPSASIERAIRGAGLSRQKSRRIREILRTIRRERGELSLQFLAEMDIGDARDYLRRFPGIGPKTVGCVLLFSFNMPILPVDTHILRIAIRLGLIDEKTSANEAHAALERLVDPGQFYNFHILLILHGRRICKARRPRCHDCVLKRICPAGGDFIRRGMAAGSLRD
jgi:endonuclease-3